MRNVTVSMPDSMLQKSRQYAKERHVSLNSLIRDLLMKTVMRSSKGQFLNETFKLMDRAKGNSKGQKWTRESLYDG